MKALVTGGNGQIGSHIIEELLSVGCKIVNIDNLVTGRKIHLKKNSGLTNHFCSIDNYELLDDVSRKFKPEIVIHCAASYKDPNDWISDIKTNCLGTANLVQISKKYKIKRFIYFQTALCYGLKPIENPITLNHPINPNGSSYAISKTCGEQYIQNSGLNYVTFRLANVIGPRNVSGPLPIFYNRLKNNKKCFVTQAKRDFVYVKDLVKVVLKAIENTGNGSYHFSSGNDVSILELYNSVVKHLKLNNYPQPDILDILPDDAESILLDPKKTFEDFGNFKFTPLDKIVEDAIIYFEKYGIKEEGFTHLKIKK